MRKFLVVCLVCFSGCAISTQRFTDISYNEDGTILRSVKGGSRVISTIGGSEVAAKQKMKMVEDIDKGWQIEMGSDNDAVAGSIPIELLRLIP